jgi:hypothetical protein
VEVAREDARRELAQEALEEARDRVRVPELVRREQVDVALCGAGPVSGGASGRGKEKRVPELKRSLSVLMTAVLPLRR